MLTATLEKPTTKKRKKSQADEVALRLEAAKRVLERRKLREWVLASTLNFSRFVGVNPYHFKRQEVMYDPDTGFYPWCPYAERAAAYFDRPGVDEHGNAIAKPKYIVFIARDHFKTTIAECALAREMLAHPEKSFMILCDKEDKATARLARVTSLLLHPKVQDLFSDRVFPYSKDYYTSGAVYMNRPGDGLNSRAPALMADGILSGLAGLHFNGVVWMDDIVTDKNYKQQEVQGQLWMKMQQVMSNVASPGCHIWVTGTRYQMGDAYRNILDHDSPIKTDIVPGHMVLGCTEPDGHGGKRPLNFLRFCIDIDDVNRPVKYRGVKFENIIRESLLVKKQSTRPVSEWYAQMENNPTSEDNAFFAADDFAHDVNCSAEKLVTWLGCPEGIAMMGENQGGLQIAVLGDPSYGGADSAVLLVVACDNKGRLYLMNGMAAPQKDLRAYFMRALEWRDKYGCTKPFGIEIHAKESSRTLCEDMARGLGVRPPLFFKLTDNSIKSKEARIQTLASYLVGGKLWFCNDFPVELRRRMQDEAMTFPNGVHDDIIDTLANAVQVFDVRRGSGKPVCLTPALNRVPRGVRRFLA